MGTLWRGCGVPTKALWLGLGPLLSLSSLSASPDCELPEGMAVPSTLVLDRSPWGGSRVARQDPTKWG